MPVRPRRRRTRRNPDLRESLPVILAGGGALAAAYYAYTQGWFGLGAKTSAALPPAGGTQPQPGQPPAPAGGTVDPAQQRRAAISAAYRDVLCREADSVSLEGYVQSGKALAVITAELRASPEGQTVEQVRAVFRELLNRDPLPNDCTGLRYYVDAVARGSTMAQVRASILGMPEYLARHPESAIVVEGLAISNVVAPAAGQPWPLTAGQSYPFTLRLRNPNSLAHQYRFTLVWRSAAGAESSRNEGYQSIAASQPVLVWLAVTLPSAPGRYQAYLSVTLADDPAHPVALVDGTRPVGGWDIQTGAPAGGDPTGCDPSGRWCWHNSMIYDTVSGTLWTVAMAPAAARAALGV